MAVLKYYGDPDALFNVYVNKNNKRGPPRALRDASEEQKHLTDHPNAAEAPAGSRTSKAQLKGTSKLPMMSPGNMGYSKKHSQALVPVKAFDANVRAMHELERIKQKKIDKEEQQLVQAQLDQRRQTFKQKKLDEEMHKRRVQMGVQSNVGGVKQELGALVVKEGKLDKKLKNPVEEKMTLVNISEEEDRDIEMLTSFMKKHAKIWKHMFQRYANQAYSVKRRTNFDELKERVQQINQAEVTKMLKEHNTYPQLISKDEVGNLLRLINAQSRAANSRDVAMLDYEQFLTFIPQLAFICFTRPPVDKSHLPTVESLRALLQTWEQATREKGKNTALFDDLDASPFNDKELIQAINKQLEKNPNYPVPEGYRRVAEKTPIYHYGVPEGAK